MVAAPSQVSDKRRPILWLTIPQGKQAEAIFAEIYEGLSIAAKSEGKDFDPTHGRSWLELLEVDHKSWSRLKVDGLGEHWMSKLLRPYAREETDGLFIFLSWLSCFKGAANPMAAAKDWSLISASEEFVFWEDISILYLALQRIALNQKG